MKETAQFFKVLADEARLKMLWLLLHRRELCVCDIMAVLGITQSKASRHLAALRHAGIAVDRKEGLWSYYSLRHGMDALAKEHLKLLRRTLAKRPDSRQLLVRLNAWLKAKKRGETCFKNVAPTQKTKTTAGSTRARFAGETQ